MREDTLSDAESVLDARPQGRWICHLHGQLLCVARLGAGSGEDSDDAGAVAQEAGGAALEVFLEVVGGGSGFKLGVKWGGD